jgi:hypothetical protein
MRARFTLIAVLIVGVPVLPSGAAGNGESTIQRVSEELKRGDAATHDADLRRCDEKSWRRRSRAISIVSGISWEPWDRNLCSLCRLRASRTCRWQFSTDWDHCGWRQRPPRTEAHGTDHRYPVLRHRGDGAGAATPRDRLAVRRPVRVVSSQDSEGGVRLGPVEIPSRSRGATVLFPAREWAPEVDQLGHRRLVEKARRASRLQWLRWFSSTPSIRRSGR